MSEDIETRLEEERDRWLDHMDDVENHRDEDDEKQCKHCLGKGYLTVEPNSSLTYQCPDCMEAES